MVEKTQFALGDTVGILTVVIGDVVLLDSTSYMTSWAKLFLLLWIVSTIRFRPRPFVTICGRTKDGLEEVLLILVVEEEEEVVVLLGWWSSELELAVVVATGFNFWKKSKYWGQWTIFSDFRSREREQNWKM